MPETQSWIQGEVKGATFSRNHTWKPPSASSSDTAAALQEEFAQRVTEIRELKADQTASPIAWIICSNPFYTRVQREL